MATITRRNRLSGAGGSLALPVLNRTRANLKDRHPDVFSRLKAEQDAWNATMLPFTSGNDSDSLSGEDLADHHGAPGTIEARRLGEGLAGATRSTTRRRIADGRVRPVGWRRLSAELPRSPAPTLRAS